MPLHWIRDPIKGKGIAPPAAPTEILLASYKNLNAALAQMVQQEELMGDAVQRDKDPESILTSQASATDWIGKLSSGCSHVAIIEDKLPIAK